MKHLKRFALGLLMLLATLSLVLIVSSFAWVYQNLPAIVSYLSWAVSGVILTYLLGAFMEDNWG